MSEDKYTALLSLLQPELLNTEELIALIKTRCSKIKNLTGLSRDRLTSLFRQAVLPLPQRKYRGNRRGKLLTARRVKSGLESGEAAKRCEDLKASKRPSGTSPGCDRLKPAPDSSTSRKIRLTSSDKLSPTNDLDKIIINERKKPRETESSEPKDHSNRLILKRHSSNTGERDKKIAKRELRIRHDGDSPETEFPEE